MAQPPRERKQPSKKLARLTPVDVRSERHGKDPHDPRSELERVDEPNVQHGSPSETQEDEVGRRQVEIDVFEAQQGGEEESAQEKRGLFSRQRERQDQEAVEESVVLEMNVVDDEESGGEEDRERCGVGDTLGVQWGRSDETDRTTTGQ
ncbi:MAG: hypothetical protein M4579_007617 [Chaenotheca gracillima]|nr:MAG: hypothetical protein M4579_007617 [Chaenotheca gracillima]